MKTVNTIRATRLSLLAGLLVLGALATGPVRAQTTDTQPVLRPALDAPAQGQAPTLSPPNAEVSSPDEAAEPGSPPGPMGEAPTAVVTAAQALGSSVLAAPEPAATSGLKTSLLVEVEGVRPDVAVTVAIFGDADSFQAGVSPVRTLSLAQNSPVARAFVLNLPAGRYAILAWQDLNGDGVAGRTRSTGSGEPVGYSRAAPIGTQVPAFEDAAFDLGSTGVTQRIVLLAD